MATTFSRDGLLEFPASVDFAPERVVIPDPDTGFPPRAAMPGSVGEPGYSPLVELPELQVVPRRLLRRPVHDFDRRAEPALHGGDRSVPERAVWE